jgi:hypothetical protein
MGYNKEGVVGSTAITGLFYLNNNKKIFFPPFSPSRMLQN